MDRNSRRTDAFYKLQETRQTKTFTPKSRICIYYKIGCENPDCLFAHSIDELVPHYCIFGADCLRKDCRYFHEGEEITRENLIKKGFKGVKMIKRRREKNTSTEGHEENTSDSENTIDNTIDPISLNEEVEKNTPAIDRNEIDLRIKEMLRTLNTADDNTLIVDYLILQLTDLQSYLL